MKSSQFCQFLKISSFLDFSFFGLSNELKNLLKESKL